MTVAEQSNGHDELPDPRLVVVRVTDAIASALTGRDGCTYESPPQQRRQALALVGLLLGRPASDLDGEERWSCAIAGGRRTIGVEATAHGGIRSDG